MTWITSFLLHPGLFWLLPLAALPILLHLLTLHRLKTVELSTFRFLFDSYVQQRRRMQFLEALLAMLRTLFLLLLILAFCRPVVKHFNQWFKAGGSGREIIMLVDCSASMQVATAGVPAIERAKTRAKEIAQHLSVEDRLTLVRVTAKPEEIFSRFTSDAEDIQNKIEDLKVGTARANMFAAFMGVFGPEAPERKNPIVYLFTDCQATGWKEVRSQGLERVIPPGAEFVVVNVGSTEPIANLAVVGDPPRRQRAIVGLPVYLEPRVVNHSKTEEAEVTVTVFIDEKEITRARLKLKPGEVGTRRIIYEPNEAGVHRGRFEISGKNKDRFPEDDNYLFTLYVVPKVKVLLVNGNAATTDPFDSETLYLKAALTMKEESAETKPPAAPPEKIPPAKDKNILRSLDPQEITEAGLTQEVLRDASVVILANCGGLNSAQFTLLQTFVAEGGGLVVLPGDRVATPDLYNTQLFVMAASAKPEVTDVRLGIIQGDPNKVDTFQRLAVIDFAHPALSAFDVADSRYFTSVTFKQRYELKLPAKRSNSWVLAEFSNGAPALVESKYGNGLLVVAAFPANSKWTNLPLKQEFVPLILRLVSHLQHRPEVDWPLVVPADGIAEIEVTGAWTPASGKVTDPAGAQTPLTFERSGTRLVSAFEKTGGRGYYTVEVHGGKPDQKLPNDPAFAVNMAKEESDFNTFTESQFHEVLPGTQLTMVDASAEAQQQSFSNPANESEIWRWLIYIVFIVIAVEFMLATSGGGRKDAADDRTVAERIRDLSPGSWVGKMTGGRGIEN